jgi:hypothetical protein
LHDDKQTVNFVLQEVIMALLDDVFSGWGGSILIGVGVALAAPILFPAVAAVARPAAKGLIKGGLFAVDSLRELVAEGGEQFSDLVAEARTEYNASVATGRRNVSSS